MGIFLLSLINITGGAICGYSFYKIRLLEKTKILLKEVAEKNKEIYKRIEVLRTKKPEALNEKDTKETFDLEGKIGLVAGIMHAIKTINGYE